MEEMLGDFIVQLVFLLLNLVDVSIVKDVLVI